MTTAAEDLRARLASLGMTQSDLARLVGRSPAAVSLWLSGKRTVPAYVTRCLDLHEQNRQLRRAAWKAAADDGAAATVA